MLEKQKIIEQIREFNRFYTALIGLLDRDYLATGYSITENRILYEVYQNKEISANYLTDKLGLDKGYISRIISGFEKKNLIERTPSDKDGRKLMIKLTDKGKIETERLIVVTNEKIAELIEPLDSNACNDLCRAMDYITDKLSKEGTENE